MSKPEALWALSFLLDYPSFESPEIVADCEKICKELMASKQISDETSALLLALLDTVLANDPMDVQETWIKRFETGRYTSLYLFEHIHGESRDRGQAIVDLKERYASKGLALADRELPDYLPVFFEYLSTCEEVEQLELLNDFAPVLRLIGARLKDDGSNWAAVPRAVLEMFSISTDTSLDSSQYLTKAPESVDEAYEEAPAFGGDPRLQRRIAAAELNGGRLPRSAPEGLPTNHPLKVKS